MKALKLIGKIIGVVLILLIVAAGVVYWMSDSRISKKYDVTPEEVSIPTGQAWLDEGERLFVSRGCADCHGADLSGVVFIDDLAAGTLAGTNLTSGNGGVANMYNDLDFVRAIRHGIGPKGRPLVFMLSHEYYPINDKQLGAIIYYIKSMPPVNNTTPLKLGPLMRILHLTGEVPLLAAELIDHQADRPAPVPEGPTIEYGNYLANSCFGCHGSELSGGAIPGVPPGTPEASNLTLHIETGLGDWSESDFFNAIRSSVRPDISKIDPFMPSNSFSKLNDMELKALWAYLQSIPIKAKGGR
ncbi:MAG: cytochrome c [Proteobacteria bacterium]|nr:cytochrome c [Pseudomonadota bacterium]